MGQVMRSHSHAKDAASQRCREAFTTTAGLGLLTELLLEQQVVGRVSGTPGALAVLAGQLAAAVLALDAPVAVLPPPSMARAASQTTALTGLAKPRPSPPARLPD